jgi:hypothetical protein
MNFDELNAMLSGAETLAKSLAAPVASTVDNKTIAAAAADGAAAGGDSGTVNSDANAESETTESGDDDGAQGGDLTKSLRPFRLVLDDGTEMEAVDASEMLKSFRTELDAEKGGRALDSEQFMKAFGSTLGIVATLTESLQKTNEVVTAQAKEIAALKGTNETLAKSLAQFGNQGRGRRTVDVVVHGKTDASAGGAGAEVPQRSRGEILAKAMSALSTKKISGIEASRIEAALNAGVAPDQSVIDRIFSQ